MPVSPSLWIFLPPKSTASTRAACHAGPGILHTQETSATCHVHRNRVLYFRFQAFDTLSRTQTGAATCGTVGMQPEAQNDSSFHSFWVYIRWTAFGRDYDHD